MNIETLIIFFLLFISHSVFLFIIINNLTNAPRLSEMKSLTENSKKVSVLIPARNEEEKLPALLESLSNQSIELHEILVLNDESTDRTADIVTQYSQRNKKIKLINGEELPVGWLGKNWACDQLAGNAQGDYYLFLDADIELSRYAIANSIHLLLKSNADMISIFPTQKIKSIGEWLVVPLVNWFLLSFLPLKKVSTSKSKSFSAATGQFILISKNIYQNIGGHKQVKNKVAEDIELAKLVKLKDGKLIVGLSENSVYCRMYNSFDEAINGFAKNFYKGINLSKPVFLLLIIILATLFITPFFMVFFNYIYILIILMISLQRIFVSILSGQNWIVNLGFHFFQMMVLLFIGIKSATSKDLKWKDRSV